MKCALYIELTIVYSVHRSNVILIDVNFIDLPLLDISNRYFHRYELTVDSTCE